MHFMLECGAINCCDDEYAASNEIKASWFLSIPWINGCAAAWGDSTLKQKKRLWKTHCHKS